MTEFESNRGPTEFAYDPNRYVGHHAIAQTVSLDTGVEHPLKNQYDTEPDWLAVQNQAVVEVPTEAARPAHFVADDELATFSL